MLSSAYVKNKELNLQNSLMLKNKLKPQQNNTSIVTSYPQMSINLLNQENL